MLLLSLADFFSKLTFKKLSRTLSECQMVRIQIRTDVLSVIAVYKSYQQTTKVTDIKKIKS